MKKSLSSIQFTSIFLSIQVLALGLVLPDYIPGWQFFYPLSTLTCYGALIVLVGKRIWSTPSPPLFTKKTSKLSKTVLALIWLTLSFVFTCIFWDMGALAPRLIKSMKVKNTTIYLLDASFLKPLTLIKKRHSFLPIMENVLLLNIPPEDIQIQSRADGLEILTPANTYYYSPEKDSLVKY